MRLARTVCDPESRVVFERRETDGRRHSMWRLGVDVTPGETSVTIADRAKWLAKLRDSEVHMAQFATDEKEGGPQILECHSPILNLLEKYPIIKRLEQDLFEAVLGTKVRREETRSSGNYECAFYFDLGSSQNGDHKIDIA